MDKHLLQEAYRTTKKLSGADPVKNFKQVLVDDDAFKTYITGLAEGIDEDKDREKFFMLAENTRVSLMENSMFQLNPYETLTMPILRVFYPRIVAKEAITVSPMDKPETIKAFLTTEFAPANSSTYYPSPVTDVDISQGPAIGTPVAATAPVPSDSFDVLAVVGLTSTDVHIERDFVITGVSADGTAFVDVNIVLAVEGHFSASVTVGGNNDVISGQVDYLNGTLAVSSATGVVTQVRFTCTCSLEENRVNPTVRLSVDKVRLNAIDRQISAEWTINMEQDLRALFDLSIQAELVNIIGQQTALDIDNEIINALNVGNTRLNPATHTGTFNRTPPVTYTWGTKYWHENIVVELNQLSAQIYTDTNIDAGNTILANPLDVAILEDLNTFAYTGTSTVDGDLGYRSATVAGGKWRVLVSSVVPQGTMLMVYKPVEELKVIYYYCPYVPAVLHPYPLGAIPSLTILTRYATAMVRPLGIAALTIGA